ncbi:Beta-mannosidase B [Cladobotryum mycophilum]|uniref:Beta-mannosidase B n=1 Tax=Cladobotryum mycophilum TaxID=491253 RepID=A0ABR0SK90_9HYPO
MAPRRVVPIDQNWQFKQADKEDASFLPVSQFPTNIHLDLLHHELIPDPFKGKYELDVQWIAEAKWQYKTEFPSPKMEGGEKAVLVFHGLDTFATVILNGKVILETDNMFIPERMDVSSLLAKDGVNELAIAFDSAYLRGWELVEKYPKHKWGEWNGDHSRLAVRKAQYHWGWDWGPILNTCGPWKPIELEIYESRLVDLYANITVNDSLDHAQVAVHASAEGKASKIRFDLSFNGSSIGSDIIDVNEDTTTTFNVQNPELWYPIRHGKQPLYTITASLLDGEDQVDSISKRIGIRKAELVQQPLKDQPGTSFFFRINNVPIFCGGSNWIPADSFTPRISKERYNEWIKLLADGNQVMIRVWGGGIYEDQAFFDACDELGILVQQDFLFGCGNYPCWPEMLNSIEREARENVKLLRHHPSIVIWAGNNEDYQYQEGEGLTYDFEDKNPDNWLKTDFPARYIYEKTLADVCRELIPDTYYHYGSPWGGKDTRDPTIGDIHQWNIWHGDQEKYQNADKLVGRFVSEFGMEAFPSARTINDFLIDGENDPERYSSSSTVDFHNKATGFERRIALYLAENFRYVTDPLEGFIYYTQLMQAECLAFAFRLWKRQWKGPGREYCGGALVWQLNDCWPVTSWSIFDYYLRPKAAYYTIKREMAPLSIGVKRNEYQTPRGKHSHVYDTKSVLEIWASNLSLDDMTVDCVVKAWNVQLGDEIFSETVSTKQLLPANQSTEIVSIDVPAHHPQDSTVVAVYLYQDGKQVARHVDWSQPLKHVVFGKAHLQKELSEDEKTVVLWANLPVKGVVVECENEEVKFDDNMVDLVPGERVSIGVRGATKDTAFKTMYYGMQF